MSAEIKVTADNGAILVRALIAEVNREHARAEVAEAALAQRDHRVVALLDHAKKTDDEFRRLVAQLVGDLLGRGDLSMDLMARVQRVFLMMQEGV